MIRPSTGTDPLSLSAMLQEMGTETGWTVLEIHSVQLMKERPGKRRVYRYRVLARRGTDSPRETVWYGKEYDGSQGERTTKLIRALQLHAPGRVRTPELIGYSDRARLLVTAALEGRSLLEVLEEHAEKAILATLADVGSSIAPFHAIGAAESNSAARITNRLHGPLEECSVLEQARERILASRHADREKVRFEDACALVQRELIGRKEVAVERERLLHRDLHPGQILLNGDEVGLVDLDEAALGEPELDLGNLDAHLILVDFQRNGAIQAASARIEAFHSGYRAEQLTIPNRIATYTAAALLRLASLDRLVADPRGSVLDWPSLSAALVDQAFKRLRSGGGAV